MRIAAILLSLIMGGCAGDGKWRQSTPHPTREQILELAKLKEPHQEPLPVPLTLTSYPQIPPAYVQVRVTCLLPAGAEGSYRFGIEGVYGAAGDVNRRELSYVFNVGCDKIQAYCEYHEYRSPHGYMEPQIKRLEIEPVGECR